MDTHVDNAWGGRQITRRRFTAGAFATVAGAGLLRSPLQAAVPNERPVVHIIGHSHIDAAWLWPWTDAADLVLTTFRSALDRIVETPGFRYSHSSAAHYRWVEQADPKMFAEIKQRIGEGRWEVVGGWPVEPDCNIPSTESFARQCLYGKRYVHSSLGVDVNIGFNPDSFGHAAGLPTVLKHAGYKYYVFMRPSDWEMDLPRMFWWEGPDGSRILTYRIYKSYDWTAENLKEAAEKIFPHDFNHGMFFFGVGDHGGAATKAQVKEILAMQSDNSLPELRWSTVHEFFYAVESSPSMQNLPVVRGDLQHHARGCYSARGEQKADNRRGEHEMFRAEAVSTFASAAYAFQYPTEPYANAWGHLLFNQFHDIAAGTALYSDYVSSRDGIGATCQTALETRHPQLIGMAKHVDLSAVREGAVFAFNPLPWKRTALLEFHADSREGNYTYLKQNDGTRVALQKRPSDSMSNFYPRWSAWVELPACGYKVLTLERDTLPAAQPYRNSVTVSRAGFGVSSLRSPDGTELLATGLGLVVIEDKSDTWAHDVPAFRDEIGRPAFVRAELVEDGPVTRVTRQHLTWRSSKITLEIAEFTASPAIELRFVIDWNEHEQILKLEVPTKFVPPKVFAKVAGAVLERNTNGNEEPYQDWVSLQGELGGKTHTVALINAQTYSYDCKDGLLRTILVRSAPYARHNPNKVEGNDNGMNAWQDQGRQERTFWLLGAAGESKDLELDRRAAELELPAEYVLDSRHGGTESWEQSFLEITPGHVEVLSIKGGEDGKAVIVRMQERSGAPTAAHLHSSVLKLDAKVALQPWELKTLAISPSGQVTPVSIMES